MVVITIDVSELDKGKNSVLCLTDGSSKKYILLSKIDKIQSELAVIPGSETAPTSAPETASETVNKLENGENLVLPS